jgi:3-deoxy-D-manno-octulosonic-acid transferase
VVAALLRAEAATVVQDGKELTAFVRRCLCDPEFTQQQGGRAAKVVASQLGATGRTVDLIEGSLDAELESRPRLAA